MSQEKKRSPAQRRAQNRLEKKLDVNISQFKKYESDKVYDEQRLDIFSEESLAQSVAEYRENMESVLDDFAKNTSLNKVDISILFLGVALQVARQFFITNDKFRMTDSKNEQVVKKPLKKLGFERILEPVPYDATHYHEGKDIFREKTGEKTHGLSGANHRSLALGHDPILGWIFGPVSILTETLTKNNIRLDTYTTVKSPSGSYKVDGVSTVFAAASESVESVNQEPTNLLIAVATHIVHLSTDVFTKLGLPLPLVNNISPDFAQMLQDKGIDVYSVSRGASLSMLINKLISTIHVLFYDKETDLKLHQVKTRKILSISNTIASSSNILYTAVTKDLTKLDLGGLCVTLYRLFTDTRFIDEIKYEYLNSQVSKIYKEKYETIIERN